MAMLLHLTSADRWARSQASGQHIDPSLETDGFIHCSTTDQIVGTANRFFPGRTDLLLLMIDTERLTAPLVFEDSYGHGVFPHLYGELNLDAVLDVVPFPPEADGSFSLPPALVD